MIRRRPRASLKTALASASLALFAITGCLDGGTTTEAGNPSLAEIREKYDVWLGIVQVSGPQALRDIKGFHDEALKGKWAGYRSSRLNIQYRLIYRVDGNKLTIYVIDVTAHDYRRRK